MVRVPNTISFRALGLDPADDIAPELPLHAMSDREVGDFIRHCGSALRSHGREFQAGHDKGNALSAFESTLALLLEVRDVYPSRRADIDQILIANGYPVPEN
jgi:hypothetical protein